MGMTLLLALATTALPTNVCPLIAYTVYWLFSKKQDFFLDLVWRLLHTEILQ